MRKYFYSLFITFILNAFAFATPVLAKSKECLLPYEMNAMQLRAIKGYMEVAAVSCDAAPQYEKVITRLRPVLKRNATILKSVFQRMNGEHAQVYLDKFITSIANQASLSSIYDRDGFCKRHKRVIHRFSSATRDNLQNLIKRYPAIALKEPPVCPTALAQN